MRGVFYGHGTVHGIAAFAFALLHMVREIECDEEWHAAYREWEET
jgi:hypothetical protein